MLSVLAFGCLQHIALLSVLGLLPELKGKPSVGAAKSGSRPKSSTS